MVQFPRTAVLELTYRCNHACLFCSCPWEAPSGGVAYVPGRELSLEEWLRALDILEKQGVDTLSISGGEALLKEGLLEILAYIRRKGVFNRDQNLVLISNGRSLDERMLAALRKYDVHLSLSLPGIETFERHTGVDNAEGVLYWLAEARKIGIRTTANVTVTRINYDELHTTLARALLAGAGTLLLNRFLPGGRGLSHVEELSLNRAQINGMLQCAERVLHLSGRIGSVGTEIPHCVIDDPGQYRHLTIGTRCSAAKHFFVVDPAGYIRVCNHSPVKAGHIFDQQIVSNTAYWRRFAERDYIPLACIGCGQVNYCDCGCRETASIVSGSLEEVDPLLSRSGFCAGAVHGT